MISINFGNITILNIKASDYCCIISLIRKKWGYKIDAKCLFGRKKWNIIFILFSCIKVSNEFLTFGNIEIENNKLYHHKIPIVLGDVDIEKVLISNNIYFGEKNYKYFIGCLYNGNKVEPLNIMLPKRSAYVKRYDGQTEWMYFSIEDDDVLEKYNTIWDEVSADIKKEFDSKPAHNKNYLKTKIKSFGDEVTDFYDKKFLS